MAQETQKGLCSNLDRWDRTGDGREFQKGGDICILWLIHVVVDSCRKQQNSIKQLSFNKK